MKKTTSKKAPVKSTAAAKAAKKPVAKKTAPAKAAPAKKAVAAKAAKKTAAKAAAKKPVAKKAAPVAPAKKPCKCNSAKPCCGKKDCDCQEKFEKLIAEIFGQLSDIRAVEELMKDFFFTELLKRKIDEDSANEMANKLTINVESFEANIDID